MAEAVVDTGFLVALLSERDRHHIWAKHAAAEYVTPWHTCEAVLSEASHILGRGGWPSFSEFLRRGAIRVSLHLDADMDRILALMDKYRDLPMGLADACLVRMTELFSEVTVLTTNSHFRVYRRHGRHVVPCLLPD